MNYLTEARNLLAKGRLDASIDILKENVQDTDLQNEVYYLQSRYNKLQNKISKGIIDDEDALLEENRITNSVLVLIANLADPDRTKPVERIPGKERFDFKWILIGLLFAVIVLGGIYIATLGGSTDPAPTVSNAEAASPPELTTPENTSIPNGESVRERSATTRQPERSQTRPADRESSSAPTPADPPAENSNPSESTTPVAETPQQPADPCASISCLNGGRCENGRCDCPPGYSGDRCQTRTRLSGEDCLRFNASNLRILAEGGKFILSDGNSRMISFPNREEAERTIALIRHYGIRGTCFARRPNPELQYFVTGNFELPQGSFSGEDCLRIRNPQNLKARSYNENSWILADGSSVLFRPKSKAETEAIQAAMRHYNPGYICYVGRPDPSVIYLRK